LRHVISVFADMRVWRLCVIGLGLAMGVYAIAFWTPTLLREAGAFSTMQIGWMSAIPNLLAVVGMFLFASSSDRKRERRCHVAFAALLGGLDLVSSVAFSHQLFLVILSLSIASVGIMSALPMTWSLLMPFVSGSNAGAAIALVNSVANIGGIVSPTLVGW